MRDGERKGRETHFWSIINNKCLLQKKKKYPTEFSTSLLWKVKSLTRGQDADGKTRFQSAHVTPAVVIFLGRLRCLATTGGGLKPSLWSSRQEDRTPASVILGVEDPSTG